MSPFCTIVWCDLQHSITIKLAIYGFDPCSKLLQETIEWLARPENYDPDRTPPGLEGFDPVPFLLSSLPITASVMATQFVHELGHRVVAFRKKARCAKVLSVLLLCSALSCQVLELYHMIS